MQHDEDDDLRGTPGGDAKSTSEDRAGLLTSYLDLERACEALGLRIARDERRLPAEVYELGAEENGRFRVEVQRASAAARALASGVYRRLKAEDRLEDLARVTRLPGVLAAGAETLDLAREVNAFKGRFKETYLAIPPERRRDAIRLAVPGIHLKQAYRQIPLFSERPRRLSFTWAASEVHSKKLSYEDVATRIGELEARCSRDVSPETCLARTHRDRERLARLSPATCFSIVRPIPPHPRVNVLERGTGKRRVMVTSIPILVPDGNWFEGDELMALTDFHPERRRARRIDRRRGELFLPPLSIYIMQPR